METRFENVTVSTEEYLRSLFTVLFRKNMLKSTLILSAGIAVYMGLLLDKGVKLHYIVFVVVCCVYIIGNVTRPRRLAKREYLQQLEYYSNSIPPMTHRFYDTYLVSNDVDSTHITPYHKLSQVRIEKGLILLYRKDDRVYSMRTDGFTKGTLADFCQFIEMKTNMAIIQK